MIVSASGFSDRHLHEMVDIMLDYLNSNGAGRKNAYCVCFEGGTFSCIDCLSSQRTRTIFDILKGVSSNAV
jgi:hypothetical protein